MQDSLSQSLDEVLAAERDWTRAHLELDIAMIERMLAPEYIQVSDTGRVIYREEALASYRSGQRHWDIAQSDELEVHLYEETAIVIGRWIGRGENHGQRFDYTARFSSVYVRREKGWQIVLDHSTPLA